jgi:hypothetical protein
MKLTTTVQVSVDGAAQGNGGPDPSGGFERGGSAKPLRVFAGYWGVRGRSGDPIVGALNTKPKYVASNTLTEPRWANTTILSGDLAVVVGQGKRMTHVTQVTWTLSSPPRNRRLAGRVGSFTSAAPESFLRDIREAVSDRESVVRSRGERPPARGTPNHRR